MISLNTGKVLLGLLLSLRFLSAWTLTMDNLGLSSNLMFNDTLVSPLKHFEFGIFKFVDKYQLCIRYRAPIEQVVTWMANRDIPLSKHSYLHLSSPDGILQLFDPATNPNTPSWFSTTASGGNLAKLLDTGNLVLTNSKGVHIWESFLHSPSLTDTLLPGQYLYKNASRNLTSWLTKDDPATGPYTFGWSSPPLDPSTPSVEGQSINESILQLAWTSPKKFMNWTGGVYIPAPYEQDPHMNKDIAFVYFNEKDGNLYTPTLPLVNPNLPPAPTLILSGTTDPVSNTVLKRLTIGIHGGLQIWQWTVDNSKTWTSKANWLVNERKNLSQCATWGICGQFGLCSPNGSSDSFQCTCPTGFKALYDNDVARGCTAIVPLNDLDPCNATEVAFTVLNGTDMPWGGDYNTSTVNDSVNCKKACLQDCNCAGAVYSKAENNTCWMKKAPLYNLGYPTTTLHGNDRVAYIKISIHQPPESRKKAKKAKLGVIVGVVLGGVFVIGVGVFSVYRYRDSLHQFCGGVWTRATRPHDDTGFPEFTGPNDAPPETLVESNRASERNILAPMHLE